MQTHDSSFPVVNIFHAKNSILNPSLQVDPAAVPAESLLIDVRDAHEHATGILPRAVLIPLRELAASIAQHAPSYATRIVCYCASGVRSQQAVQSLRALGYQAVVSLRGGVRAWMAAGLPVYASHAACDFTADERLRYQRHFALSDVGDAGQRALRNAKVLLVGVGGLGSPIAYYLAAAGVGRLGLIDDDVVEVSNLQRQILYATAQVGTPKVYAARDVLYALNPHVAIAVYPEKLTEHNAEPRIAAYDLVIDGSDNFPARYLINDTCLRVGRPFVYGSVYHFDGQVSTFHPEDGPCYRCLFPHAPSGTLAPNCAEAGVLGVLPGIVGTLQAMEAMKIILRIGTSLVGRLLCIDALTGTQSTIATRVNPQCSCHHMRATRNALSLASTHSIAPPVIDIS